MTSSPTQHESPHTNVVIAGQQSPPAHSAPVMQHVSPQQTVEPVGQQLPPQQVRPGSQQLSPQQELPAGQQVSPQQTQSGWQQFGPQQPPVLTGPQVVPSHSVTGSAQKPLKQLSEQHWKRSVQACPFGTRHSSSFGQHDVPFGQLVGVQRQFPPEQIGTSAGHTKHCSPSVPQSTPSPASFRHAPACPVPLTQHPLGHDSSVQTHAWSWQMVLVDPQSRQVPPPLPHTPSAVPGWQAPCWSQQPCGQGTHCAPSKPHAGVFVRHRPGASGPFSQQPAHSPARQTQTWSRHSVPGPQVSHVSPPLPQKSGTSPSRQTAEGPLSG